MSIPALNWARRQQVGCSGAKFVLWALANYADDNGYCFPSQETIAAVTEQNERTVRRHLGLLEDSNLIRREPRRDERGRRTSDEFHLQLSDARNNRPRPDNMSDREHASRTETTKPSGHNSPDQPDTMPGKPLEEPSEESCIDRQHSAFEAAWLAYGHPKAGDAKDEAQRAWNDALETGAKPDRLVASAQAHGDWVRAEPDHHPCKMAKWLRERHYEAMDTYHDHDRQLGLRKRHGKVDEAHAKTWAEFRQSIVNSESEAYAASWIDPLSFDGTTIIAPSEFHRDYLLRQFGDLIEARGWKMVSRFTRG